MDKIRELESLDLYKAYKVMGEGSSADVFPPKQYSRLYWYFSEDNHMLGVVLHDHEHTRWGWYVMPQINAETPGGARVLGVSPGLEGGYLGIIEEHVMWYETLEIAVSELHKAMLAQPN